MEREKERSKLKQIIGKGSISISKYYFQDIIKFYS